MASGVDLGVWEEKIDYRILLCSLPGEHADADAGVVTGDTGDFLCSCL